MPDMKKFKIMGGEFEAPYRENLLNVLWRNGFEVPSLCYNEALSAYGACRLCLVEVKKGKRTRLTTSCNYPIQEGIEVFLDTEKVQKNRRMVLELLIAKAPKARKLRDLADKYGVDEERLGRLKFGDGTEKCILCGLCERACREVVGASAITFAFRGDRKQVAPPYLEESPLCIGCGACAYVCPTGAVSVVEKDGVRVIDRWNRKLEMQKCEVCGVPFAPKYQLFHFKKLVNYKEEYLRKCPGCRDI